MKKFGKKLLAMTLAAAILGTGFPCGDMERKQNKLLAASLQKTVISDLSDESDFKNWKGEGGWQYFHGGSGNLAPELSYDADGKRLKVSVDYSANDRETWSEAKVRYTAAEPVSLSDSNRISVDVTYPAGEMPDTQIKFYAKDAETGSNEVINVYGYVPTENVTDAGDGYQTATVSLNISKRDCTVTDITVGIVGCKTAFQGDVYLDNLMVSSEVADDVYTKILSQPNAEGTKTKVQLPKTSVQLTDPLATKSAKALYAYLYNLDEQNQVLFGHQNDVSRSVSGGELGDVYDVTGSVSGMFGIDTLSLFGTEAGGTDAADALQKSIAYSRQAADHGAIITLSAHMPNFTSDKIKSKENGTYDFHDCDFDESKDTTNGVLKQILPGGDENEVFCAYLDTIADYAAALDEEKIPIIFRPYHENTGSWFWWGSMNDSESYKSLYRYTRDYLESKGVHNMLYVYSPNGPVASAEEYLEYYPGDAYVDILAFDYYDDYSTYPAEPDVSFFDELDASCAIVSTLAKEHGKIAAIAETGVRVQKEKGDSEGLLVQGNPIGSQKAGKNWYQEVSNVAKKNDMPYFLVWSNFSEQNFYVPYRCSDELGQELVNDFIDYYNSADSVFGDGTQFYDNRKTLAEVRLQTYTAPAGYMVWPFELDTIVKPVTLMASAKNANSVKFVITDDANKKSVELPAALKDGLYQAKLDQTSMDAIGATDTASITLVAGGNTLATLNNISIGKEKPVSPEGVLEDFDYYVGSNGLLATSYTGNSASGCSSTLTLDGENKADGSYGGAFHYQLTTTGEEVWTGQISASLSNHDFSAYDGIRLWTKMDGKGQKVVIQLTDGSGEEFEVYLTNLSNTEEAYDVTIPFSSLQGKQGGTLDTSDITKFAIWCNSIGAVDIQSTIYFDAVRGVKISDKAAKKVDEDGLIVKKAAGFPMMVVGIVLVIFAALAGFFLGRILRKFKNKKQI